VIQQEWNDWDKLEQRWSWLKSDNLRKGCRLQDRGTVQGRSESRQHVIAHRDGGREARLARSGRDSRTCGVLGSWNEGPSRDWTWWRLDGWVTVKPRRREGELGERPSLAITAIFFLNLLMYFGFVEQKGKKERWGGRDQGGRGVWVLRRVGPHTNNARSTWIFSVFHHLQKDKQRKQRHSLCEAR